MKPDVIEKLGNSTIQHGKHNDRIYVLKAAPPETESLPEALKELADERGYTKIFAKIPAGQARAFVEEDFRCEARVPRLYGGRESALMLSCFLDEERERSQTAARNEAVMSVCRRRRKEPADAALPERAVLRVCRAEDAGAMAEVYRLVFPTYPFPISDAGYLRRTMASHIVYFGVWLAGELAALSSAEMDTAAGAVEMTDFATLPRYRGQSLATSLLSAMEVEMQRRGMATAYTIARAPSFGMNITFARMGYRFGGRLINNTNIGGQFEDMNVWHKSLVA